MKEVLPGWLMVEVPEDSVRHFIDDDGDILYWLEKDNVPYDIGYIDIDSPPGSYEIVGIVTEVSEEVAAGVVEKVDFKTVSGVILYHNYDALGRDFRDIVETAFETAKESLTSLARSNGFEPERTLLIRKIK